MILEPLNLNRLLGFLPDQSRFNLMDVFCIGEKELAHSNFIKYLLEKNHIDIFGAKLFLEILKKHKVIDEEIDTDCNYYKIYRELYNIDILIECPAEKLIVAIENKLNSSEGEKQLQRYQELLNKKYENYKKYLLFLTPTGRNALTANEDNLITPCIPLSYEIINELIGRIMKCTDDESYKTFLGIMKDHLEGNIVTNKELKQEIHKIWGDPEQRRILKLVFENRAHLGHIKDSYVSKARQHVLSKYNDELIIDLYPGKGNPREIKLRSKKLSDKSINVYFMLLDYETDYYPCFRVVIKSEDYYKNVEVYDKVAEILNNGSVFAKINSIPGWGYWMSLLLEDNSQPDHIFKNKHEYGEDFALIAFEIFNEQYDKVSGLLYKKFNL